MYIHYSRLELPKGRSLNLQKLITSTKFTLNNFFFFLTTNLKLHTFRLQEHQTSIFILTA